MFVLFVPFYCRFLLDLYVGDLNTANRSLQCCVHTCAQREGRLVTHKEGRESKKKEERREGGAWQRRSTSLCLGQVIYLFVPPLQQNQSQIFHLLKISIFLHSIIAYIFSFLLSIISQYLKLSSAHS